MLDLNLSFDCNGKAELEEAAQSPATSFSSAANGDGGGETSSSNDDTCSPRAAAFSFDILANNGDGDRGSGLVTRELFPVGRLNPGKQITSGVQQPEQKVPQVQARKSRRGPRSRSSQYRGVTFYRRTGRWESHIWDCRKQVYLGGFDTAIAAARAYDRAAIKFRGVEADINFNLNDYEEDMKQTKNLSKEEFVHILRRQSTGFSRGSSKYRGVTLHKCGRWEARMGQFLGKKAYDQAAIKFNGRDAVTNFEPSTYDGEMISETYNQGSRNDLDLNLGISTSSPKETGNLGSFQFHPYDVNSARILKEQAVEQRAKSVSQQRVGNKWTWQMQDQVHTDPIATLSTAASSGFSSSPPFSNSSSSSSSYPMAFNLCFSTCPNSSFLPRP